jgi:PAS domain S-box-containing protein
MSELGRKTKQRQEADERYRNVIEMARSAFITFIEDGKIVIANNAAVRLLGLPREDLIGISIFNFMVRKEILEQEIALSLSSDQSWSGKSISLKLKDIRGQEHEVELSLSATMSEGRPMFTAIIHDSSTYQP